jgi:hypothetical protein
MDLGAYAQIEDLEQVMRDNGISVPRLRGLRLMKDEEPTTKEKIDEEVNFVWLCKCKDMCCSYFIMNADFVDFCYRTDKIMKKYLVYKNDDIFPVGVNWKNAHGKKRKMFRYALKQANKRVRAQFDTFNKYCGREDVLYIHARIGGDNWSYFGGDEIAKLPWFIEKVDDAFDCTYCDIYARIK